MSSFAPAVDCGAPPTVWNAVMGVTQRTTYGENVTYSCLPDYWFSRERYSQTIHCQYNGYWSKIATSCKGNKSL